MEEVMLKIRVGALIAHLLPYYQALDLGEVFASDSEFDKRMKEYFTDIFNVMEEADDIGEVANHITSQPMFKIDTDITDLLYAWSGQLVKTLKDRDGMQLSLDYLVRYNRQVFDFYRDNVALYDVGLLWGISENLTIEARRFLALSIFYLLTKAYSADVDTMKDKLKAVEAFFYIRDYIVNDADYPTEYLDDEFETLELKSLMTHQELHLSSYLKTMTAAGAVASSIQREDLEGGKRRSKQESSKPRKYNRIERLEDD